MKYEYLAFTLSNLCALVLGIYGGFIVGITAVGPQEPINLIILFGSAIVLTLGAIHMILKKESEWNK